MWEAVALGGVMVGTIKAPPLLGKSILKRSWVEQVRKSNVSNVTSRLKTLVEESIKVPSTIYFHRLIKQTHRY